MKKKLTFCIALIVLLSVLLLPGTTACADGISWSLSGSTLTVTGTGTVGPYSFASSLSDDITTSPAEDYGSSITSLVVGEGITYLGNLAFYGLTNLTEITLPSTLTGYSYGDNEPSVYSAFDFSGKKLQRINWGGTTDQWIRLQGKTLSLYGDLGSRNVMFSSPTLYIDGAPLTEVVLTPDSPDLRFDAFDNCQTITKLTVKEGYTGTIHSAFYNCPNLRDIYFEGDAPTIDSYAFSGITATVHYTDNATWVGKTQSYGGTLTWVDQGGIKAHGFRGDTNWKLLTDGTLVISGSGDIPGFSYPFTVEWHAYKDEITEIVIQDGVTGIGDYAFYNCTNLVSVTLPDSLISIGSRAFCNCVGITSMTIPELVTSVGSYAFSGCTSLTAISFWDNIESIRDFAFSGCSDLQEVTYAGSQAEWSNIAVETGNEALTNAEVNCLDIIEFGTYANLSWTLSSSGLLTISGDGPMIDFSSSDKSNAWRDNASFISSVNIDEGITRIGAYAFKECSLLTEVSIPASVTSIGTCAFQYCSRLTCVTIPATVLHFGNAVFNACDKLTSAGPIGSGCNIEYGWTSEIPGYAFYGAYSLKRVLLSDTLTSIGTYAFENCMMPELTIPEGVTSIGSYAFYASGLRSITLPQSLQSVDNRAFDACYLNDIYYNGTQAQWNRLSFPGSTNIWQATLHCVRLINIAAIEHGTVAVTIDGEAAAASAEGAVVSIEFTPDEGYELESLSVTANGEELSVIDGQFIMPNADVTVTAVFDRAIVASGECGAQGDNLLWTLYEDGELVISGTGQMKDYFSCGPWVDYSDIITSIRILDGVTSIGEFAFINCVNVQSVTIPEGVTNVGVYGFYNCGSLTELTLPDSMTSFGIHAFDFCGSLAAFHIGAGNSAFSSYEGVLYNSDQTTLLRCPEGKTGEHLIPESVTSLASSAFRSCSKLTRVTIPESVTNISEAAFSGCSGMTSIEIPESVTTIEAGAFRGCSGLTSIEIPEGVTTIGAGAFRDCSGLTSIEIPEGVTSLEGNYLSATYQHNGIFAGCTALTSVILPENLNHIGDCAFYQCSSLTDVYYPGTQAQWDEISVGTYNDSLANATLHCVRLIGVAEAEHGTVAVTIDGEPAEASLEGAAVSLTITPDEGYELKSLSVSADGEEVPVTDGQFIMPNADVTVTAVFDRGTIASGECGAQGDNLTWVLYDDGELVISGEGEMADYNDAPNTPWLPHIDVLSTIVIESGVTSIGNYAFEFCSSLTSITIPESVTSIGNMAFDSCTSLTSITIPEGVTSIGGWAFQTCGSLTSITIPESVTSISEGVFSLCGSLTSITIPEGVTSIGGWAFKCCSSLTSITIPESVTDVGDYAFDGCTSLTSITIPEGVTSIGNYAFNGCTLLADVHYGGTEEQKNALVGNGWSTTGNGPLFNAEWHYAPAGPAIIDSGECGAQGDNLTWTLYDDGELVISGTGAMNGYSLTGNGVSTSTAPWIGKDTAVKTVTLAEGVTSIGKYAFYDCTEITDISIPESVSSIGSYAFNGCTALSQIDLPGGLKAISTGLFRNCSSLRSVSIPDGVTTIGQAAFQGSSRLESVDIPDSVTYMNDYVFENCSSLVSVSIPDGISFIEQRTFTNCSSLKTVYLGSKVTSIREDAFYGCNALKDVYYNGTEEEWTTVFIGNNNVPLKLATIHYAGSAIIASGDCGAQGDNLTWTLYDNGELVISGSGAIQAYEQGQAPWAEYGEQITSVSLPEGLTSVGSYAFADIPGLTEIVLPGTVTALGDGAFSSCGQLKHIVIPASVTDFGHSAFGGCAAESAGPMGGAYDIEFGAQESIPDRMFDACVSLTTVSFSDALTHIGNEAFNCCYALKEFDIPEGVTSIGYNTFFNCRALTRLSIPASLEYLGSSFADFCPNLTEIAVAAGNAYFSSLDGVLFKVDQTELIRCPMGKTGHYAVPETVTRIDSLSFIKCSALNAITLPASVTEIGRNAFVDCSALETVYFGASEATKNERMGNGWGTEGNDSLFNAEWQYAGPTIIASGECGAQGGNLLWTLYEDGELVISGEGEMADYYDANAPWYAVKDSIQTVTIEPGATSIGNNSFNGCSRLSHVVIPEGVTRIGVSAFYGCTTLPDVSFPTSVKTIEYLAFNGCSSLTSMNIADLAAWCEINFPAYDSHPFINCYSNGGGTLCLNGEPITALEIPDGVTSIPHDAFFACSNLTSVTIPDSVTSIGEGAFFSCSGLESVSIGSGMTDMGYRAFEGAGVKSVTFRGSAPTIDSSCFSGIVATVYYPSGDASYTAENMLDYGGNLTWIPVSEHTVIASGECGAQGDNLTWTLYDDGELVISGDGEMMSYPSPGTPPWYEYRNDITVVTVESGVTNISDFSFVDCVALSSVTIPDTVTRIGREAFDYCESLTSITIPDSVASIDECVFYCCTSLTSITLPNSLTYISSLTFAGCTDLTSVTLPASVTNIGDDAFDGCTALTDVYYGGTEEQKNTLIDNGWSTSGNEALFGATWHYIFPTVIASGECGAQGDNLTWTLYDDGELVISGEGEMADYYDSNAPWYAVKDSILTVTVESGVTGIGTYAFCEYDTITHMTLPASVVRVGEWAVHGCIGLKTAGPIGGGYDYEFGWTEAIPARAFDSIGGLSDDPGLTAVEIPIGMTSIGDYAFSGCRGISEMILPASVTSIGTEAFYGWDGLTDVYYGGTEEQKNTLIDNGWSTSGNDALFGATWHYTDPTIIASGECGAQGDNVTWVLYDNGELVISGEGEMADYNPNYQYISDGGGSSGTPWYDWHKSILRVVIEPGVTSIGDYAIGYCDELTVASIPDTVSRIGNGAFHICRKLVAIVIPEGVESIGFEAFSECDNLESVLLPDSLLNIDGYGFYACRSLSSITLPSRLSGIGDAAFANCTGLTSILLPDSMTSIGIYAFSDCSGISELTLPVGVTSIGTEAFRGCDGLTDVYFGGTEEQKNTLIDNGWSTSGNEALFGATWHCALPDYDCVLPAALKTIEEEAMAGCSFRAVRIPDGATAIGKRAFANSPNLKLVYIPESVTTIAADAFYRVKGLTIVGKPGSEAEDFADALGYMFIAD